ncbi:uncharacterized protein H6S33_005858 [Morchella sextelata]|uniref:uncharacterized protein n=1 Tax=Morchella sextelata TaxID=1174677 RepID=UPI001D03B2E5|nr:uncharacterized protein H6S33_005858 [Morchella sextelata]KAH0613972.1 hypothetical protein H6S33_005858 [Morchella sextelata]
MTKPSAVILVADGSEEIEFVTAFDVLVRAGFNVRSIAVRRADAQSQNRVWVELSRGLKIIPDQDGFANNNADDIESDILIIPGGGPGAKTLSEDKVTLELIHRCRREGKWIACICAGTTALVASASSFPEQGKVKVTSHPCVKDEIVAKGWEYEEERVVVDGKVITSRGPGTALLWVLTIVELICGKEKRMEVEGPMITSTVL